MGEREKKTKRRGIPAFLRSKGRLWLLAGGVILGVLLLLMGGGVSTEGKQTDAVQQEKTETAQDLANYQKALESELEGLCEAVAGVGQADVMVTLGSSCRVIYTTEADGEVVVVGSGNSQKPLSRTLQPPTVVGVGVVCKGGQNAAVQHTLTELISTTLGIPSNRVYITGK